MADSSRSLVVLSRFNEFRLSDDGRHIATTDLWFPLAWAAGLICQDWMLSAIT